MWNSSYNIMYNILTRFYRPVSVTLVNFSSCETFSSLSSFQNNHFFLFQSVKCFHKISIGNYTVREVLMQNRTRVWRNVYNTASV